MVMLQLLTSLYISWIFFFHNYFKIIIVRLTENVSAKLYTIDTYVSWGMVRFNHEWEKLLSVLHVGMVMGKMVAPIINV